MDYGEHYKAIEVRLRQLLAAEDGVFSGESVAEVEEFIEAREYGLALETFAAILLELPGNLEGGTVDEVQQIANSMGLFNEKAINNVVAQYERQGYRLAM